MPTITIHRRMIRQSPRKLRLVSQVVAKKPVAWALAQLHVMPKRASREIAKAVQSAKAAALQKNMAEDRLMIQRIQADQGPGLKRILPGSRGRTYRIKKMFGHVTVTVSDDLKPKTEKRKNARTKKS